MRIKYILRRILIRFVLSAVAYSRRLVPMYSFVVILDIVFIPLFYRQCPVFGKLRDERFRNFIIDHIESI